MNDRTTRRSLGLTAGGNRVHPTVTRIVPVDEPDENGKPRVDRVPIIERYQDLAQVMHRTAAAPRGDRFLLGCTCGWFTLTSINVGQARADLQCRQHVVDAADTMFAKLEPKELGNDA